MLRKQTLLLIAAGLLAGVLAFQPPAGLEASACGGPGAMVCKETESCVWVGWARICTTKTDYWSSDGGGTECERLWATCPLCHCRPNVE